MLPCCGYMGAMDGAGAIRWKEDANVFTLDNTDGFSSSDLERMNAIAAALLGEFFPKTASRAEWQYSTLDYELIQRVEEAVGQVYDPALSDAENEHLARNRLEDAC